MLSAQLDTPMVGDIIRYRYLSAADAARGREAKSIRNCLVLHVAPVGDRHEVLVVPLSHEKQADGIATTIPTSIREAMGVNEHYVGHGEANVFTWPSPDVIPVLTREMESAGRRQLPEYFASAVKSEFQHARMEGKAGVVDRESLTQDRLADFRRKRLARARDMERGR